MVPLAGQDEAPDRPPRSCCLVHASFLCIGIENKWCTSLFGPTYFRCGTVSEGKIECVYSRYMTLSRRTKTIQQRGAELHNTVRDCRPWGHRYVESGEGSASSLCSTEEIIVSVLHLSRCPITYFQNIVNNVWSVWCFITVGLRAVLPATVRSPEPRDMCN